MSGAQGAAGKDPAITGLMRELHALTERSEKHRVIADNIAAADRMDANLGRGAFANDALSAVTQCRRRKLALFEDDFQ